MNNEENGIVQKYNAIFCVLSCERNMYLIILDEKQIKLLIIK